MDENRVGACADRRIHQLIERDLGVLIVDAEPALDRDRNGNRRLHRRDTRRDRPGFAHQAGAEGPGLHAIRRTADIEVDLVIAEVFGDPRRLGEFRGLRAAKLNRNRVLVRREAEQPRAVAMDHSVGDDHLGIETRPPRQQPVEIPAVTVGPVHHRGDGKAVGRVHVA